MPYSMRLAKGKSSPSRALGRSIRAWAVRGKRCPSVKRRCFRARGATFRQGIPFRGPSSASIERLAVADGEPVAEVFKAKTRIQPIDQDLADPLATHESAKDSPAQGSPQDPQAFALTEPVGRTSPNPSAPRARAASSDSGRVGEAPVQASSEEVLAVEKPESTQPKRATRKTHGVFFRLVVRLVRPP